MSFLTAQASTPHSLPPIPPQSSTGLETAALLSLIGSAITVTGGILAAVGNKFWGWFQTKEKSEADQYSQLLNTFLTERTELLNINREGFKTNQEASKEIVQALHDVKSTNSQVAAAIHKDIQTSMVGQTGIVKNINESLIEIKLDVQALHSRFDEEFGPRKRGQTGNFSQ